MKSNQEFLEGIYQKVALQKEQPSISRSGRSSWGVSFGAVACAAAAVFCFIMNAQFSQNDTPALVRLEPGTSASAWPWVVCGVVLLLAAIGFGVWRIILHRKRQG